VHLIGFIIRIYHDARSSECQRCKNIWQVSDIYCMLGVMGVLLAFVLKLTVWTPRVRVATGVFFHFYNFLQ